MDIIIEEKWDSYKEKFILWLNNLAVKYNNNERLQEIITLLLEHLNENKVITWFNQNFSMLPNITDEMITNIKLLKPEMLRYPWWTNTHSWDWKNGIITTRKTKNIHKITEIKELTDKLWVKFVFVLDILNRSLEDQIEMLKEIQKLWVEISYIELWNELYAQESNYKNIFPTWTEYWLKVNKWIPELRKNFPNVKISALLSPRKTKETNERMYNWNKLVVEKTFNNVDVYTYHFYINENATFEEEKIDFIEITKNANTREKELWITEYWNKQDKNNESYYDELSKLADFIETYPNVTIALNV